MKCYPMECGQIFVRYFGGGGGDYSRGGYYSRKYVSYFQTVNS